MKKLLTAFCFVAISLTACQKTDGPKELPNTQEQTAQAQHDDQHNHDDHNHDDHDHHSDDHNHNHAHSHGHEDDEHYICQGKTITVGVHEHEGETEAHATIDDIEYDFHPDTANPKQFVSQDGVGGSPMLMVLGDDKVSFYDYKDNKQGTLIFDCAEQDIDVPPTAKPQA